MLRRRARRDRKGQAAVFIALIFFGLLLFVAMATNIGIAVNDRIRFQTAADLGAYAVAYHEATVLNQLVEDNREIASIVASCRDRLTGRLWDICDCAYPDVRADTIIDSCRGELDAAIGRFMQHAVYSYSVGPALEDGYETAAKNVNGLERYTHVTFFEDKVGSSPTAMGTYWTTVHFNFGGAVSVPTIAQYEQVNLKFSYWRWLRCPCEDGCCPGPTYVVTRTAWAWFYKHDDEPEIWVASRVKGTPLKRFLDIDYSASLGSDQGYFGGSSTGTSRDVIYAYAVAKPFEGSVGPTNASYWDRMGEWVMGGVHVSGPAGSTSGQKWTLGMLDEYRARLAGLVEDLQPVRPTVLAAMDHGWNTAYFKH